jgi:plastocyanin
MKRNAITQSFARRATRLIVATLALGAVSAVAADESAVAVDNFAFAPAALSVKAGTRVVFVNHDDIPHSVVAADGSFRSKALDTDDRFTMTFDKPGEYSYYCGLHPFMKGKIIVTP